MGFEHKAQRNTGQQTSLNDLLFPKQILFFSPVCEKGTNCGLIYLLLLTFEHCNHLWPICACVIYKKSAYLRGQRETSCCVSTNIVPEPSGHFWKKNKKKHGDVGQAIQTKSVWSFRITLGMQQRSLQIQCQFYTKTIFSMRDNQDIKSPFKYFVKCDNGLVNVSNK